MKRLLRAALAALAALPIPAVAQDYPTKPVRMLVGFSAGGGADTLARIVAGRMGELLGQQIVVENRPGAGGTLAADALAKAAADGYTTYFADTSILIAPSVYARVTYDPLKSFAPVGGACTLPLAIMANPAVPARNAAELIALLKAHPGKYSYGSPGFGTVHHLAFELFKSRAGVDVVHVPYKGASPIIPDIVSGQIPLAIMSASPALAQARGGRLRPIGLTSPMKLADAPGWAALADTFPGFDASPRLFLIAPAGTPAAAIAKLNEALKGTLSTRDVLDSFVKQGASATYSTPDALGAELAAELAKWSAAAKAAGLKAQ